jgi:hypothetical protein
MEPEHNQKSLDFLVELRNTVNQERKRVLQHIDELNEHVERELEPKLRDIDTAIGAIRAMQRGQERAEDQAEAMVKNHVNRFSGKERE